VAFAPYTAGQISEIIINRLESLSDLSGTDSATQSNNTTQQLLMQRPAIELCARKVAAIGDLRKALDICR
jgi:Cdc6-like AAA superfamily ATPase